MIKSISTHLFVYYTLDSDILRLISREGFGTIELWGMRPHFDYRTDSVVSKMERWLKDENITVKSAHMPMYVHRNDARMKKWLKLSDPVKQHRRAAVEESIIAGQAITSLGTDLLTIHTGIEEDDPADAEKWLEESVYGIHDKIGNNGIRILVENTPTDLNGMKRLKGLAEKLPSSGVCLDLGHANMGHDPVKMIKFFGEAIFSIHASDNDGDNDAHMIPGKGNIDFRESVKALKEMEFSGPFVYELRDYDEGKEAPETLKSSVTEASRFHDRISPA